MDTSPHKSNFVNVNGIRLHYLDWGGEGEALIFLMGLGSSSHDFDRIAPRFTDKFRVLALTRRGSGESDHPETGYDIDILIDDILAFMDALHIEKAILAGHSFAGVELTYFTEKYPDRISKLVYLDAVYDPKGMSEVLKNSPVNSIRSPDEKTEFATVEEYVEYLRCLRPDLDSLWNEIFDVTVMFDLEKNADGNFVEKDTSNIAHQMLESVATYDPQNANIRAPVLRFEAHNDPVRPTYFTDEQRNAADDFHHNQWIPFARKVTARFKNEIPQAKIIAIPNGHHYCFISHEDLVYDEMKKFLLA
jgi:pimeloyl-ACP methyl ester carboxylesterase